MEVHRRHCNIVKGMLIKTIVDLFKENNIKKKVYLLDLCSGRGGDMFKWNNCKITKVIGIDNHEDSFREAVIRYKKTNKKFFKTKISYYLDDVAKCDFNKYTKGLKFLIVSCQFALHYFQDLNAIIVKISNATRKGGYFIGVCPDGDIIKQFITEQKTIEGVEIKPVDDYTYDFKLIEKTEVTNNKAENYFSFRKSEFSREFYVYKDTLKTIAETHGLRLCSFCNLQTHFNGTSAISGLYFSFVFQKMF